MIHCYLLLPISEADVLKNGIVPLKISRVVMQILVRRES